MFPLNPARRTGENQSSHGGDGRGFVGGEDIFGMVDELEGFTGVAESCFYFGFDGVLARPAFPGTRVRAGRMRELP